MTTSSLQNSGRLRALHRFLVIIGVLLKEGFEYLFHRQPIEEHLYHIVVRLGPTFIKLAQVASTRPDFVPEHISTRFKSLQEHVPPFAFTEAKILIETELKQSIDAVFETFSSEPIAAASLSQVYFATLLDEQPVAVKVQRPNIDTLIQSDLSILVTFAWLAERINRVARDLHVTDAVKEFGRWTLKELNFENEAHNAEVFRRNFSEWEDVIFPEIYWSHTTSRVLTMQRMSGMRVDEVLGKVGPEFGRKLAKRLAAIEMKMFITDAFFHADLHPGNIFFQPDGGIAVIDLGMVGQMTLEQRDRFLAYWIAITRRDRDRAFYHLLQMASSTQSADLDGFRLSYNISLDRFYDKELSERSLAQTYLDIIVSGARFGVAFPSEMVLQAKAVVTAEALDLVLAPDFRFADEVRPIVANELAQRAQPSLLIDRLWDSLTEWVLLGEIAQPRVLNTHERPAETDFRREAKAALSNVWLDALETQLFDIQGRLPQYTSATYWREHPEYRTLLEIMFGFLSLLTSNISRIKEESDIDESPFEMDECMTSTHDANQRWQAFSKSKTKGAQDDELMQVFSYLGNLVAQFDKYDFWESRPIDRARLMSMLSLTRFLLLQFGQATHENLNGTR